MYIYIYLLYHTIPLYMLQGEMMSFGEISENQTRPLIWTKKWIQTVSPATLWLCQNSYYNYNDPLVLSNNSY